MNRQLLNFIATVLFTGALIGLFHMVQADIDFALNYNGHSKDLIYKDGVFTDVNMHGVSVTAFKIPDEESGYVILTNYSEEPIEFYWVLSFVINKDYKRIGPRRKAELGVLNAFTHRIDLTSVKEIYIEVYP
jgi:hypothetical protein